MSFKDYKFKPYDPSWLVDAAVKQYPDDHALHEALRKCTMASGKIPMIYFVSPKSANTPGAEWQFETNIILEETSEGEIVLDILKDGRVGGAEFVSHL